MTVPEVGEGQLGLFGRLGRIGCVRPAIGGLELYLSDERQIVQREKMVAGYRVVVGGRRTAALNLDSLGHSRRPGNLPFEQDRELAASFGGVPEEFGLAQLRVDAKSRAVQAAAGFPDVEIGHLVSARPGTGRQARPSGRGQGGMYADHVTVHAVIDEPGEVGAFDLPGTSSGKAPCSYRPTRLG